MEVKTFVGKEINNEVINKVLNIAKNRYDARIFDEYYGKVKDVIDLADVHGVDVNEESIILGDDWFFAYADLGDVICILEWISSNDKRDNITRSMEMKKHILTFFKENSDKMFETAMRHDTSYRFYKSLCKYGLFEEFFHDVILDVSVPPELTRLIDNKYNGDVAKFVNSDEFSKYPEYHKFIMHSLIFSCTFRPELGENMGDEEDLDHTI